METKTKILEKKMKKLSRIKDSFWGFRQYAKIKVKTMSFL